MMIRNLYIAFTAMLIVMGTDPSHAKTPCADEIENAQKNYNKVINSGSKGVKSKTRSHMKNAMSALERNDTKACHKAVNKIHNLAKGL